MLPLTTMKGDLTGLVDSEAAARLLGITPNNFRVRVHRGEIPVALRVGRTPLFEKAALKALKASAPTSTEPTPKAKKRPVRATARRASR